MHFPVFCNKLAVWVPHCAGIVKFIIVFLRKCSSNQEYIVLFSSL
nr:unnamed protein product [Callosobruchus chinensis]CAH7727784.1 unnamed protein product [Callosobruchus chinensis]CAH7731366.1 unnamed protein product [Callosobruchus chinensis]CAH7743068.1 unnamed protein product [Callosobruchus chinensis]